MIRDLLLAAALAIVLLSAACATPTSLAPRYFTGVGFMGRPVCVDSDTGALYLLTKCDEPKR